MPISINEVFLVSFISLQQYIAADLCVAQVVFVFAATKEAHFCLSSTCTIYGATQHGGWLQRFIKTGRLLFLLYLFVSTCICFFFATLFFYDLPYQ